ncbi:helix-turn-helix domain-containing protein [Paenarthrobacter sp. DKR-5]|uniref:helix-turn-helix domain-containing protein n=1 Tax=Paenarthrobacter sp. DKR-5 TaxID=2835535 RepID=UPI001BDCAEA1|nr:helix-turn-helix transcriptional regulator [Paenarthrobacter sp. DKR-5]MBT1002632.1 helix-turn-helix domain-containing protein [Paenarthrobacter sp. DKR-5]
MSEDQENNRAVGRAVARLREETGLSQSELAQALRSRGVPWTQGTLSRVENGDRAVKLTEAPALASALGSTIDQLLTTPVDDLNATLVDVINRLKAVDDMSDQVIRTLSQMRQELRAININLVLTPQLGPTAADIDEMGNEVPASAHELSEGDARKGAR